ncbi:MAG: hypothetical protein KFF73_14500 [Cyclobacteriaceae bacterium]|nr:hypothetical protein [Cyclobacteriaceae bacterium]
MTQYEKINQQHRFIFPFRINNILLCQGTGKDQSRLNLSTGRYDQCPKTGHGINYTPRLGGCASTGNRNVPADVQGNPQSSIYAFGIEDTKEALRNRWTDGPGLEVENNIKLVRSSEVFERGDVIAADLVVENSTNDMKGYIEAKCSAFNRCLVLLLIVPEAFLEDSKKGLQQFMDNSVLAEPTMGDIYENFVWADFFGGKYLATRQVNPYEKAKRNNQLWMCPDGSFRSYIKIKGFANIEKQIKGNRSGTWEATGTGPDGKLLLHFKKMAEPLEVPVELREDQLFIKDIR